MKESKTLYWKLSAYFFFFFFTWSYSYSLFSIWLGQEMKLSGTETGIIFSANAIFALCMQPLYGYISDKIGLKKNILFFISILLVLVGPFYIYVYGPLLQYNVLLGAIVGGLYLGIAFLAGIGAIESYVEKIGRKYGFEYGKSRMWGSLGWAAATFFAGQLFNVNPNINFWVASISAVILVGIIISVKVEITNQEIERAESITLKDAGQLFLLKDFWFFMLYVIGVTCIYGVYDQQFPVYYSSLFPNEAMGNQVFGYLNSFQVFLEAGMMFLAPFIVNKLGAKNSLILAGFLMAIRIIGSGLVVGPIGISSMKLIHAVELPIMLIAIFKYLAANFDTRLSSVLYLVGFQFAKQVGESILSPIAGRLYDSIGFRQTYLTLGVVVLTFTIISIFTLLNSKKNKRTNQPVGMLEEVV
ncbi:MFS transporter [Heyndrickxia sporothermodurans]|uniref:MFS transporter n=1 Tax=Heyndrickxia sporothermodurans TaxID=46224 RepID=A0AB37HLJ8_9BACI|nr:MFS transporter [Heyndrickxia sporothermodurans]MBL5768111.1 MFS transporter [Heyndrickxia sporothermodurans]MBL5771764.1 MFS transporter [Heyndrickxia sporothermodurans]MBL5775410.1 MFS transporter [Heyndrickxia sporothermodurans]MBL5778874.1 MFS transporter [Heyndrickxia sporothermodurans]MBL5782275.1 MFS transporter [Heyndrickxia sporothermodurans]